MFLPAASYRYHGSDPMRLIVMQEPFNAEPHRSALVSSYITPVDFFYKRNHGPIPKIDDISRFSFLRKNYKYPYIIMIYCKPLSKGPNLI